MANELHSHALAQSTTEVRPESSSSTNMAEEMSISWSDDLSSPTDPHRIPWELSLFTLEGHPEASPNSQTTSHSGAQMGQEHIRAEFDAPLSAAFEGTPSLADSFSSVDSDGMPTNPRAAKSVIPSSPSRIPKADSVRYTDRVKPNAGAARAEEEK